jgi:hypothetical protein
MSHPSPPRSLRRAVYTYLLCGRNFIVKRRLLLFIKQHQLAREFAEYWAIQAVTPILATRLPANGEPEKLSLLWNRDAYQLQSLCSLAMLIVPDFTSAFDSVFKSKIVADGPIADASEIELTSCDRTEFDDAIRDNQRMNHCSHKWSNSYEVSSVAISFTATLRTYDCLIVQFRERGFLHIDIGAMHLRLQCSLYVP